MLGYYINPAGIFVSNGKHQSKPPYVDFLLAQGQGNLNVCYHLDYNVSCLLVLLKLTQPQLIKLYETSELSTSGYRFKYIPKKFLSIAHGDKFAVFSDAAQYMDRWDVKFGTPEEKCKEALDIAQGVFNALKNLGIKPKTLVSPISAFDKQYLDKVDFPTVEDIPLEASDYAYKCVRGPWVEAYQRGRFENVRDWDLTSAYPSMLAKLIDPRLGKWVKSTQWEKDAYYGYVYGEITINSKFTPIIYSRHHERSNNPNGTWVDYFAKQEIDFIHNYNRGEFELIDGWWYFPEKITYPLRPLILWLYNKKEKSTGLEKRIVKRITNGLWGRLLQVDFDDVPGQRFFSVWGEEVECNVRLEVAKFVIDNKLEDWLLCITVDGVLENKPNV